MHCWLQPLRNNGKRNKSPIDWDKEKPYTLRMKFQRLHVNCIMNQNPKWRENLPLPTSSIPQGLHCTCGIKRWQRRTESKHWSPLPQRTKDLPECTSIVTNCRGRALSGTQSPACVLVPLPQVEVEKELSPRALQFLKMGQNTHIREQREIRSDPKSWEVCCKAQRNQSSFGKLVTRL